MVMSSQAQSWKTGNFNYNNKFLVKVDKQHYFDNKKITFYRLANIPKFQEYQDIILAGRGDIYREGCGDFYGSYSCKDGHTRKHKNKYCYKLDCPICFHKSIHRTARRLMTKLSKYKKVHKIHYKHISFNIYWNSKLYHKLLREDRDKANNYYRSHKIWDIHNLEQLKKAKKKLQRILKKYGCSGILIFHPYRPNKNIKGDLNRSPHFHFIGFSYLPEKNNIPDGDLFYKKYGFTFTDISYKKKKDKKALKPYIRTRKELYSTIRYILTHTAYLGSKRKSYGLIGQLHPIHWNIESEEKIEPLLCKHCNEKIYKIITPSTQTIINNEAYLEYDLTTLEFDETLFLKQVKFIFKPKFKHLQCYAPFNLDKIHNHYYIYNLKEKIKREDLQYHKDKRLKLNFVLFPRKED